MKGSRRVPRGADKGCGVEESALPSTLSSSSTYISAKWYARLAGTLMSVGLEETSTFKKLV